MPKLFLVGITPDHRGLVLSEHARAKRGDMVLEIDDRLLEAIDKANRLRTRDEGHRLDSAALPSKWEDADGDAGVPRLTPREIQQRLRAGETVAALARSSGTDEAWIRRFAVPVLAAPSTAPADASPTATGVAPTSEGEEPTAASPVAPAADAPASAGAGDAKAVQTETVQELPLREAAPLPAGDPPRKAPAPRK